MSKFIVRCIAIFIFALANSVNAQQVLASSPASQVTGAPSLARPVTLDLKGVTPAAALAEITKQTGVEFGYQVGLLPNRPSVTLKLSGVSGEQAALRVLAGM